MSICAKHIYKVIKGLSMKKNLDRTIIIILFICWCLFVIIVLSACAAKTEYKDVYIPQKCQVDMPPKLDCSSVRSDEYEKITHCMIWNKKREELLEAKLNFCIGE